ncbi:unnamed protein product, partial [Hymenolepis diminuta]
PNLNFLTSLPLDSSRYSKSIEITNRVSSVLDKAPLSPENLFYEVFQSPNTMVEAFKEQLRLESQGQVQIPPALPFFEEMLKDAPQIAKTLPQHSQSQQKIHRSHRQQMRKLLETEQNTNWCRQLTSAFEAALQRLKSAHTQGQITAYPFLKILPKKSYVDLMIQAVNTIVTDTELQHV